MNQSVSRARSDDGHQRIDGSLVGDSRARSARAVACVSGDSLPDGAGTFSMNPAPRSVTTSGVSSPSSSLRRNRLAYTSMMLEYVLLLSSHTCSINSARLTTRPAWRARWCRKVNSFVVSGISRMPRRT